MQQHPTSRTDYFFAFSAVLLFTFSLLLSAPSSADEYSVEYILGLEQRLEELKKEIKIIKRKPHDHYNELDPALYLIKQKSWNKSISVIAPHIDTSTAEYSDYANILYGISLQGLNKRKQALNHYTQIAKSSRHYPTAQINIALLEISDGQLIEATDTINEVLSDPDIVLDIQMKDRLLLTAGALYYKQHRYRDAKNTFGKISHSSSHANKALIGMALSELKLKNYRRSRHYLKLLSHGPAFDLSNDESYLILAFTYESQKKYTESSAAYEKAIRHYKKRMSNIEKLLKKDESTALDFVIDDGIFIVSDNRINLSKEMPETFIENYQTLKTFLKAIKKYADEESVIHKRSTVLYTDYNKLIDHLLRKQLRIRNTQISGYLKQSEYGHVFSNDNLAE